MKKPRAADRIAAYLAGCGATAVEIADDLGMALATVQRVLRRHRDRFAAEPLYTAGGGVGMGTGRAPSLWALRPVALRPCEPFVYPAG